MTGAAPGCGGAVGRKEGGVCLTSLSCCWTVILPPSSASSLPCLAIALRSPFERLTIAIGLRT